MPAPPQPLASLSQVLHTPSAKDGVPDWLENDLRVVGCMLIQEAGILMKLPQSTMATAQVLFQRFFYVSSLSSFGVNDISISALYLSSKLNETPLKIRDLINVYILLTSRIEHILSLPADKPLPTRPGSHTEGLEHGWQFTPPGYHAEIFWDWKDTMVVSEIQILKRLGFNMQVDLPYSHVVNYCRILDLIEVPRVVQSCWGILNDALLTPIYTHHPPPTLACAAILLVSRLQRIPLPDQWWVLFDTEYDDLWTCCGIIVTLYRQWGIGTLDGLTEQADDSIKRDQRYRRAWLLAKGGRKAVRAWVSETAKSS